MGNQQKEGIHYQLGELYAPVMKATEVRLFMAITANHGIKVFKSDTKKAMERWETRKYTPVFLLVGLNEFRRGMLCF